MPIQGFPGMTIHPILIASMVSVHVAGYETKSTPLKKRHWRTFVTVEILLILQVGRRGLRFTSHFTYMALFQDISPDVCCCFDLLLQHVFVAVFFWHFARPNG